MPIKAGTTFKNLKQLLVVLNLPDYQGGFQKSLRFNKANKILARMGLTIQKVEEHTHRLKIVKLED